MRFDDQFRWNAVVLPDGAYPSPRPLSLLAVMVLSGVVSGCGDAASGSSAADSLHVVGLKAAGMDFHAARQHSPNWCRAASVQMALSTRGIEVSQQEIVVRA